MRRRVSLMLLLAGAIAYAHDQDEVSVKWFDEKPGAFVPLDVSFSAEQGEPTTLRSVLGAPTILTFVFYHCPDGCPLLQAKLATTLRSLPARPGTDYSVGTVSVDEKETSDQARASKQISMSTLPKDFPETAWRFLTGGDREIHELTDAVGFHS